MNNRIDLIEKKIIDLKSEMNSLMSDCQDITTNNDFFEYRVGCIKRELAELEQSVRVVQYEHSQALSRSASAPFKPEAAPVNNQNVSWERSVKESAKPVDAPANMPVNQQLVQSGMPVSRPINQPINQPVNQPVNQPRPLPQKDFEKTFGKSFMGIFASLLIFISFILFATIVYKDLSDDIKMISLYVISSIFIIVGLVLLNKDSKNKFYLSLTGCGVGALYISLILTNVWFNAIDELGLYICILIWAIAVCVLSKLKSNIFMFIGQIGITISIMLGCALTLNDWDTDKFFILTLYYIVSFCIFSFSHLQKSYAKNNISNTFFVINSALMLFTVDGFNSIKSDEAFKLGIIKPATAIIALFIVIYVIFTQLYCKKENISANASLAIFSSAHYVLIVAALSCANSIFAVDLTAGNIFILLAIVGMYTYTILQYKELDTICSLVVTIPISLLALITTAGIEPLYENSAFYLLAIAFMFTGFPRNSKYFKYAALICMGISALMIEVSPVPCAIFGVISISLFAWQIYKYKEQYVPGITNTCYLISLFFIAMSFDTISAKYQLSELNWDAYILFALLVVINAIASKTKLLANPNNNFLERSTERVTYFVNGILIFLSFILLFDYRTDGQHFIILCFSLVTLMLNSISLIKRYNSAAVDIYVGIKSTIYLIAVLSSFDTEAFVISVGCFVLAIASIGVGFMLKQKPLRLYGLVLSMISVVKLVMIDIYYDNTLGRALSFFVSGLLCFVISMIYSSIDKKMNNSQ